MRCKACDVIIQGPIMVEDKLTKEKHEEWLCSKCNRYSFAFGTSNDFDEILDKITHDGYIETDTGEVDNDEVE